MFVLWHLTLIVYYRIIANLPLELEFTSLSCWLLARRLLIISHGEGMSTCLIQVVKPVDKSNHIVFTSNPIFVNTNVFKLVLMNTNSHVNCVNATGLAQHLTVNKLRLKNNGPGLGTNIKIDVGEIALLIMKFALLVFIKFNIEIKLNRTAGPMSVATKPVFILGACYENYKT